MRQALTILASLAAFAGAAPLAAQSLKGEYLNMMYASAAFEGSELVLTYELPCGTELHGFVFATPQRDSVRVGVVGRTTGFACMGMPRVETRRMGAFLLGAYKKVTILHPQNYRSPLFVSKSLDARTGGEGAQARFEVSYRPSCAQSLGVFFKPLAGDVMAHGVLMMRDGKAARQASCLEGVTKTELKGFAVKKPTRLTAFTGGKAKDPMSAFYLRLAAIKPGSVDVLADGNVRFTYVRRCNEAPVGVVLGPTGKAKDRRSIGILVAHYFNQPCSRARNVWFASAYRSRFLDLAHGDALTPMAIEDARELTVRQANQLGYQDDTAKGGIALSYFRGCQARIGTLVAADASGSPVIGVVEKAPVKQCKARLKEVSFQEDIFINAAAQPRLRSFSLEGA